MNSVSEFVKRERRRAGLTQEDFAIRCGVGLSFCATSSKERRAAEWIRSIRSSPCSTMNLFLAGLKRIDDGRPDQL